MNTIVITDEDGDTLKFPEGWDGAVVRGGRVVPATVQAQDWLPGDVVECLCKIDGKLAPVKFKVARREMLANYETEETWHKERECSS